jgi:hypothetical protein
MYLPCVLRATSNSDIANRRSRETAGRLQYQLVKRSRRLDAFETLAHHAVDLGCVTKRRSPASATAYTTTARSWRGRCDCDNQARPEAKARLTRCIADCCEDVIAH